MKFQTSSLIFSKTETVTANGEAVFSNTVTIGFVLAKHGRGTKLTGRDAVPDLVNLSRFNSSDVDVHV